VWYYFVFILLFELSAWCLVERTGRKAVHVVYNFPILFRLKKQSNILNPLLYYQRQSNYIYIYIYNGGQNVFSCQTLFYA
jgi:hypothetical protein